MTSDVHWATEEVPDSQNEGEAAFYRQTICRCSLGYDHYKDSTRRWVDNPCQICADKDFICDVDAEVITCPGEECADCDYKKGDLIAREDPRSATRYYDDP